MFASAARVKDADVDAMIGALCRVTGPVPLNALADHVGWSARRTETVVQRLVDAGAATLHDGVVTPRVGDSGAAARASVRTHTAEDAKQAIAESRIDAVRWYAESQHCRRAELLAYFGEHYEPPCGNCDNDHRLLDSEPHRSSRPAETPASAAGVAGDVTVGSRVTHTTWGDGVVLSVDAHELVVVFDTAGYRHLTPAVITRGLLRVLPASPLAR